MLWALEYDGTEWGMPPQDPLLFFPRRKLLALKKLATLSPTEDYVDDNCDFDSDFDLDCDDFSGTFLGW